MVDLEMAKFGFGFRFGLLGSEPVINPVFWHSGLGQAQHGKI